MATQAYRHGLGQWFGGRLLDVILLLSVSTGMQDAARDKYINGMRDCLDAVSGLVDPRGRRNTDTPSVAQEKRRATDDDMTRYLGLMAAGLRNANKQGFASFGELRKAMDALRETISDIRASSGSG